MRLRVYYTTFVPGNRMGGGSGFRDLKDLKEVQDWLRRENEFEYESGISVISDIQEIN